MLTHITWASGHTDPWDQGVLLAQQSVGPGWGPLVKELMTALAREGWDGHLYQIKEKFGGLRFYTGSLTDSQQLLVDQAEATSRRTCEICGSPGEVRDSHGWLRALCHGCDVRRRSEV